MDVSVELMENTNMCGLGPSFGWPRIGSVEDALIL